LKIAIHQPNFLPWRGYFDKIKKVDVFVILDNAQYTKNSYINRNKIKTAAGATWLGLPIKKSGQSKQNISEVSLYQADFHKKKILKSIATNYSPSIHFEKVFPSFSKVFLDTSSDRLVDINLSLLNWTLELLEIKTEIIMASSLDLKLSKGTDRLVEICKCLDARTYLSGAGAAKYQDENKFDSAGIKLEYQHFQQSSYPQLWGDYLPNLSIIDYLFNWSLDVE